jgi:hypothetical protein
MELRDPVGLGRRPGGPTPSGLALAGDRAPEPYPPYPPYPSAVLRASPLPEARPGRAICAPSAEDSRAGPAGGGAGLRPADGPRGTGAAWLNSAESSASMRRAKAFGRGVVCRSRS